MYNFKSSFDNSPFTARCKRLFIKIAALRCMWLGLLLGMLTLLSFAYLRSQEEAQVQNLFEHDAQRLLTQVEANIQSSLDDLTILGVNFEIQSVTDRRTFHILTQALMTEGFAAQALEWIPRVAGSERAHYVAAARAEGLTNFDFTERLPDGSLLAAGQNASYFPVYYAEPMAGNEKAMGFDLNSNPTRRLTINQAILSKSLTATARIKLLQETSDQYGVLVFKPVFEPLSAAHAASEQLKGFALAVFRIGNLVEGRTDQATSALQLAVFDEDAVKGEHLLYPKALNIDDPSALTTARKLSKRITLAQRHWLVVASPKPDAYQANRTASSLDLLLGLTLTWVLALQLRRQTQQLEFIKAAVEERTAELTRERLRLKTILETAIDGIHILDDSGLLVEANRAFLEMLGLDESAIGRLRVADWDTLHDQTRVEEILAALIHTPATQLAETQNRHSDGHLIDVEVRTRIIEIDGQALVYCNSRDVTDRKRKQQQLESVLAEQSAILEHELAGFIKLQDRRIVWANMAIEKMFRVAPGSLQGKSTLKFYPNDAAYAAFGARCYPVMKTGQVFRDQLELIREDGTQLWADLSGAMLDPQQATSVWCFLDVTESTLQKRALEESKLRAESASIAKSQFLATMSHEIRTPLNGLLGMAQALLQPELSEADRLNYAETVLKSGNNLLTLLNDILDIAKIEAGKVELELLAFSPSLILEEVQSIFAALAAEKALRVKAISQLPAEQQYLLDHHRLRQMLDNLISNALKFTSHGHILIEAFELERQGMTAILEFAVSDTGIGIAPDKLSTLFKRFSQTDSSITRQFGGTGLGLSLVKQLAQLMGGEAGLSSELGQGSRFWFRIRAKVVDAQTSNINSTRRSTGIPSDIHLLSELSGRVLLVDDIETNRIVITAILKKSGVELTLAENGQQAFDVLREATQPFDLVLMDIQMPVMDGYEATRQIRRWEAQTGRDPIPIVALTADTYSKDRQRCLEAGMNDFLPKPIRVDRLQQMLSQWMIKI